MDRYTEIQLFVRVAELASLSGAARTVGLSNPAASRYLASLENRLKVRLVERNTRRMHLTNEGLNFYERAKVLLNDWEEAEAEVSNTTSHPVGTLRISASVSCSMLLLASRLHRYHARYPQVHVHIETANRYLDMLDNGIDLAIRTREYEPDSSITIRRLAQTRRILAASPKYLSERGRPSHPSDLQHHDLLIYVHANTPHELNLTQGAECSSIKVKGLLESNDGQVLRAAALADLGILVQPSYILYDDLVAGRLVPVLENWDLPRLHINIAYPSRRHLSAKVRTFIDFLVEEFTVSEYEKKWTTRWL